MRKMTKKYSEKSPAELVKEAEALRREITKINLESRLAPQKDSNVAFKKRKQLAVVLTILNSKKTGAVKN